MTPSSRAQVGTVIEALQRVACAARAASNAQREKIRQAHVGGTYRQAMNVDLEKLVAYEEGILYALLVVQEAEAVARGSDRRPARPSRPSTELRSAR